jgi:hypothetical protein
LDDEELAHALPNRIDGLAALARGDSSGHGRSWIRPALR